MKAPIKPDVGYAVVIENHSETQIQLFEYEDHALEMASEYLAIMLDSVVTVWKYHVVHHLMVFDERCSND